LKPAPRGTSEGDIARVLGDDVRAEKVNKLLAGPGYLLPADIELQLSRSDTAWTLATGTVDYAAFKPEIKPTDADLAEWFEESGGRYDILHGHGRRRNVQICGLHSPAHCRKLRCAPTTTPIRPASQDERSQAGRPQTPANPAADFAAARPQVEAGLELERGQALGHQGRQRSDPRIVRGSRTPRRPRSIRSSPPRNSRSRRWRLFNRESGPAEFGGSAEIAAEAFRLGRGPPYLRGGHRFSTAQPC
jgi:peptidyl-prolyl cis-trans isomerase D